MSKTAFSISTFVAALAVAVLPAATAGAATTTPAHHCWNGCDGEWGSGWGRAYGPIAPGSRGDGYSEGDGSYRRHFGGGYGPAEYCSAHPWRCD